MQASGVCLNGDECLNESSIREPLKYENNSKIDKNIQFQTETASFATQLFGLKFHYRAKAFNDGSKSFPQHLRPHELSFAIQLFLAKVYLYGQRY